MQTTFKENIKNLMLKNIDYLVEKFTNQICSDPDQVEGEWIHLIYNNLDIEYLNIYSLHYISDTLSIRKSIYLFEIQTDDIKYEYDQLIKNQSSKHIDDNLKTKLYHQAIKKVLEIEIDYIWLA
mgnify:CR=1 FL=1